MKARLPRSCRRQHGFSLIEMLLVLGLLGLLATLVITQAGTLFGGAEEDVAKQFVTQAVKAPLLKYRIDMGGYPSTADGLKALLNAPSGQNAGNWKGPYIEKLPTDPWKNEYQYRYPGTRNPSSYDIFSLGPDGVESGDDIGNWE